MMLYISDVLYAVEVHSSFKWKVVVDNELTFLSQGRLLRRRFSQPRLHRQSSTLALDLGIAHL